MDDLFENDLYSLHLQKDLSGGRGLSSRAVSEWSNKYEIGKVNPNELVLWISRGGNQRKSIDNSQTRVRLLWNAS